MTLDKNLIIFQPISAVLIFAMAVFGGFLPYMIAKNKNVDKILSYLNCASGGVLAGVALLHVLPETGETMNEACGDFPMSYCITFVGIMLMTLMLSLGHDHQHGTKGEGQPLIGSEGKPAEESSSCSHGHGAEEAHAHAHEHCHEHEHGHKPTKNSILMLLLGLLIHDLSEGIMLGLQTDFESAIYLSFAILLHKWCDVSVQVVQGIRGGCTMKQNAILCIPLVIATPLTQMIAYGIVLATTTEGMSEGLEITQDFFMSFACGTFLAIIFLEILAAELMERTKGECLKRAGVVCVGFLLIAISSIIEAVGGV